MMRKEAKIGIIIFSMVILIIIGYVGWISIDKDEKYSIRELLLKYPLISDLKMAVDSGELDYDKLPSSAKEALVKYESSQDEIGVSIIEGINP